MKYYSKSPSEFRRTLKEISDGEKTKRKKSFLLQFANYGILMVALFLMVRSPAMMKKMAGKSESGADSEKSLVWKGLSLESVCRQGEYCTLSLTKQKDELDVDAFFWKVEDEENKRVVLKTFELIPKSMKKDETRSFHLPFEESYMDKSISVHFIDNSNEEQLSMEIYP